MPQRSSLWNKNRKHTVYFSPWYSHFLNQERVHDVFDETSLALWCPWCLLSCCCDFETGARAVSLVLGGLAAGSLPSSFKGSSILPGMWTLWLSHVHLGEELWLQKEAGLTSPPTAVLGTPLWRGQPVTSTLTPGKTSSTCAFHDPSMLQVASQVWERETGRGGGGGIQPGLW